MAGNASGDTPRVRQSDGGQQVGGNEGRTNPAGASLEPDGAPGDDTASRAAERARRGQDSPSTPTERGDGDYEGSASSLARQNAPREPNRGQYREPLLPAAEPEAPGLRGVEDK